MDFLKKGQDLLKKSTSGGSTSNTTQAPVVDGQPPVAGQPAAAGQSKDYGDKAFDFIQKKTGHTFTPDQSEKATDAARGLYEKQTGKKVDPKYSN